MYVYVCIQHALKATPELVKVVPFGEGKRRLGVQRMG